MATYELMANNELIENPSPRSACMVILDTSISISGWLELPDKNTSLCINI